MGNFTSRFFDFSTPCNTQQHPATLKAQIGVNNRFFFSNRHFIPTFSLEKILACVILQEPAARISFGGRKKSPD
jgi:hypothetical protein